jgi:hypothetical protein
MDGGIMNIPDKVKIGGLIYDVFETENISFGNDFNGETDFRALKINIRPMARARMERTFLHEIIHTFFDNLGHTIHDEKHIDELAGELYEFVCDNPSVFVKGEERNI